MPFARSISTFSGVRALRKSGEITVGSFTTIHDKNILSKYQLLKANTCVDEVSLKAELFAKGDRNRKDFMMQRQLVGLFLTQDLPDGERRLPIEVYGRLAVLLQSRPFTEEEDKAILEWVDKQGLTKWNALARTLGRSYAQAGVAVKDRYQLVRDRMASSRKKTGKYDPEELEEIMKHVLACNGGKVDQSLPKGVDWEVLASQMNRTRLSVYDVYR